MGKVPEAKDVYREGLAVTKQLSRVDGILKNQVGLAKVAMIEGNEQVAKQTFEKAAEVAKLLLRLDLAEEYEAYSKRLPEEPPDIIS